MLFSKTNIFYFVISAGIIMTSLLCSLYFNNNSASAYTASITTNDSISFDISPSGDGTSIHSESINVQSDCRAGYNLTIATPEGSSLYKYENNTQAGTASFTAVDGTSALNNSNNTNKWGYTLTANPTSNTVFLPLSSTQAVLKTPSQTASSEADINDTFDINYGAKADNTVEVGNYQMSNNGAIVYYLTMDISCTQYTVSFNPNGGSGNITEQGIEIGEPTKLSSSKLLTAPVGGSYENANGDTITGDPDKLWTFWGWNTSADGTGDWYKDKEAVENLTSVGSTITLYAQWKQATLADMTTGTSVTTEKVIDHNEMQDMSPETCYNSTAYSTDTSSDAHNPYDPSTNPNGYHTITLLDYRGKVTTGENPESPESYTVSKLPDNLCWMTSNLNIGRESGGENNDGTITLTSDDTDIVDNTTFVLPASPTAYISGNSGYAVPQVLINHTVSSYKVGNVTYTPNNSYYSWAAAIASTTPISSGGWINTNTSICPKNWDLATVDQYDYLDETGSIDTAAVAVSAPFNFIYGGLRNGDNQFSSETSYGYYWSSTSASSSSGSIAFAYKWGLAHNSQYKYYGASIRCVASQGKASIYYDGNGDSQYPVTGTVSPQENIEINVEKIKSNGFSRSGWYFNGWNTEIDGSGMVIDASKPLSELGIKPGAVLTLYAQWLPYYNITYINNCKSWTGNDVNCTDSSSAGSNTQRAKIDASGNVANELYGRYYYTMSGWKILEWTTNADGTGEGYLSGSVYNVSNVWYGDSITLYAHWVPVYTLQYDGNGADNASTGMGSTDSLTGIKTVRHTNVAEGDTFDLFASNFKRDGYGFVGWSIDADAWNKLIDNDASNDVRIWGGNEMISAPAYNNTPIMTLYAVWAPAEKDGDNNPVYLQNWSGCASLTATIYNSNDKSFTVASDSIIALTDERNGQVYTIGRLTDGNCWMMENLRLDNTVELSVTNTNIQLSNSTLPLTNIYNEDASLAVKSNYLSPSSGFNTNADYAWCTTFNASCIDQSRINTANTTWNNGDAASVTPSRTQNVTSMKAHASFDNFVYSYGNYYNWYSATAGYGTYSRSTSTPTAGDICPIGWHLPYGGTGTGNKGGKTSGGFSYLDTTMGGSGGQGTDETSLNKWRAFPNNYLFSGFMFSETSILRGDRAAYSSASASNSGNAWELFFKTNEVTPGSTGSSKNDGRTIRCVLGI